MSFITTRREEEEMRVEERRGGAEGREYSAIDDDATPLVGSEGTVQQTKPKPSILCFSTLISATGEKTYIQWLPLSSGMH